MFDRDEVLAFVPNGRGGVGLRGIAARLIWLIDNVGLINLRVQIGSVFLCLVANVNQGGRKPSDLRFLGEYQRDWLVVELDLVVVKRAKGRTAGETLVIVGLVGTRHLRPVLMGQHIQHTLDGKRSARVDSRDAASCDGRGDNAGIDEIGSSKFTSVLRPAGDLRASVDAGRGGAYV